jgi:hypothetical protein
VKLTSPCSVEVKKTWIYSSTPPIRLHGAMGKYVGDTHMSDNRQMSVSRKWLVDFVSMVTQYYNNTLPRNYTGVTTTTTSIVYYRVLHPVARNIKLVVSTKDTIK